VWLICYRIWLICGVALLLAAAAPLAQAQTAEDKLGNWLIYNGTFRFSDRWSMFTEAQLRLYEPVSNRNEAFARVAPQYHFTPDALAAVGYLRGATWPFDDTAGDSLDTTENRIYEQFSIHHDWDRTNFEHRYRLEQRWIERADETEYSSRARYRIQITVPLNRKAMEPGAFFVNAYDEIFINLGSAAHFDQNRLYGAGGYQFSPNTLLQLGYLYNTRQTENLHRLQMFLTWNFDLR